MLSELSAGDYEVVRPLFAPIAYNLAIESIIAGLSPGSIYVDHADDPKIAVTRTRSRVFLGGQTQSEATLAALRRHFIEKITPEVAAAGLDSYILHFTPGWGWEAQIESILSGKHPMRSTRHYYALNASDREWDVQLPAGFELQAVDRALLARTNLRHLEGVREEMESERPSVEDFLAKSFGYCVVHEEAIVAWCMSEYNCGRRCEIGIYTEEEVRRHGLATATATAVISQALAEGISKIGWHCWASNAPSIATAFKLGFTLVESHPVYFAYIDPQVNMVVNGIMSINAKEGGKALDWFEQARNLGDLPDWADEHVARARNMIS